MGLRGDAGGCSGCCSGSIVVVVLFRDNDQVLLWLLLLLFCIVNSILCDEYGYGGSCSGGACFAFALRRKGRPSSRPRTTPIITVDRNAPQHSLIHRTPPDTLIQYRPSDRVGSLTETLIHYTPTTITPLASIECGVVTPTTITIQTFEKTPIAIASPPFQLLLAHRGGTQTRPLLLVLSIWI